MRRDPWGLNERAFARYYPLLVGMSERAGGAQLRARVIARAAGRTLELGTGNGYNLPHYTESVTDLVLTEPSAHMLTALRRRLDRQPPAVGDWQLVRTGAEALPFADGSFDTVTTGYLQCTVPNPDLAIAEIVRVLKPGGRYLFIEHVRAAEGTVLGRMQDAIEPLHVYLAAGCHPNRRTADLLERSALAIDWIEHATMPLASPSVRPVILGAAAKPSG